MAKRQRMGWWFLCLACVVVMVCTAQRMAGLHALQMNTPAATVVASAQTEADDASPVTPCELSAKSLLAAPPVSAFRWPSDFYRQAVKSLSADAARIS